MKQLGYPFLALVLSATCGGHSSPPTADAESLHFDGGATSQIADATFATDADSNLGSSSDASSLVKDGAVPNSDSAGSSDFTAKSVAVHTYGGCALTGTGKMICWGEDPTLPGSAIPSDPGPFVAIAGGRLNIVAMAADGTMRTFVSSLNTPLLPLPGRWIQVAVSGDICAVAADGHVECGGNGGTSDELTSPDNNLSFSQVAVGQNYACGIASASEHTITCWGGPAQTRDCVSANPAWDQLTPPAGGFKQVCSGSATVCGIRLDDTAACWGIGAPSTVQMTGTCAGWDYGQAIPPAGTFKQISAGTFTVCGVRTDDTLACWGAGKTVDACTSSPILACGQALPPTGTFTQVAVGYTHACAIRTNGKIACWGSNTGGRSTPPAELQ
jgi:hypothetical protein